MARKPSFWESLAIALALLGLVYAIYSAESLESLTLATFRASQNEPSLEPEFIQNSDGTWRVLYHEGLSITVKTSPEVKAVD